MSDPRSNSKAEDETVRLNLAPFAPGRKTPAPSPGSTPPDEEGITMIVAQAAADVAQKKPDPATPTPPPPRPEMLGAVAYSYAKGVYRSEDISRKMEGNPEYRAASGERVPDAQAIRRFRRLNRDAIMETLAKVFRRQRKQRSTEALSQTLPGAEPAATSGQQGVPEPGETTLISRRDAEQKLNNAAWVDNMSKDD